MTHFHRLPTENMTSSTGQARKNSTCHWPDPAALDDAAQRDAEAQPGDLQREVRREERRHAWRPAGASEAHVELAGEKARVTEEEMAERIQPQELVHVEAILGGEQLHDERPLTPSRRGSRFTVSL